MTDAEKAQQWVKILHVDPAHPSRHYDIAVAVLSTWRDDHHETSTLNQLFDREAIQAALIHFLKMRNTLRDAIPEGEPTRPGG
jgi:hypothetical protein